VGHTNSSEPSADTVNWFAVGNQHSDQRRPDQDSGAGHFLARHLGHPSSREVEGDVLTCL
jgi:hypothetical protein